MLMELKRSSFLLCLFLYLPVIAWAFDDFDCVGTKPFWRLAITEKKVTFSQQNTDPIVLPATEPKAAENMSMDHIRVFRTKLGNNEFVIVVQKQSCTDSATEDMFAYEGLFISPDKVFHGCCNKKILVSD